MGKKKRAMRESYPEKLELEVKASEPPPSDKPESSKPPQTEEVKASEPHSESTQATITTTESVKRKSGGPRSVCAMYKVVKKKALGKKIKVTYNELGVPNGSTRHTLQSYVGMIARSMVPIDIESWPHVSSELKQKLWTDVQVIYNLFREKYSVYNMMWI